MRSGVKRILLESIEELNQDADERISLHNGEDTPIFGSGSDLDSLGLVNLIVAVEEKIESDFSVSITLADEKAMSQKTSPFRTVGTLIEYIEGLIRIEND